MRVGHGGLQSRSEVIARARNARRGAQLAEKDAGALASPRRTGNRSHGSLLGRCPMLRQSLILQSWPSGFWADGRTLKQCLIDVTHREDFPVAGYTLVGA